METLEIPESGLLSRDQVAKLLGKSKITVMKWSLFGLAGKGKLPMVRVGHSVYYDAVVLRKYLGIGQEEKPIAPVAKGKGLSKETKDELRRDGFDV